MITRYKTDVSRGEYVFGSVILPYMLQDVDTQGSVFYGNYCEIGREGEIEINPRLPTEETVLEFKNLTPFEVLCIFASDVVCSGMQSDSKINSQEIQISWYLDDEHISPYRSKVSSVTPNAAHNLMRASLHHEPTDVVKVAIYGDSQARFYDHFSGNRGYTNKRGKYSSLPTDTDGGGRNLELFTLWRKLNNYDHPPEILGFVENGVLFTEKGDMRKVANDAYLYQKNVSSYPKAFKEFELVHSVMHELISLALTNLVKIATWEYEGELYSLRIRRSDFEYFLNGDYGIPLGEMLSTLSDDSNTFSYYILWDDFRGEPISVLNFDEGAHGHFRSQPFENREWCVARALYSLIFIAHKEDFKVFHKFVHYSYMYDMKNDANGQIRELMVIESIRQYFQAQALGREMLPDVEEAYEDTLESLHYHFKNMRNNPSTEYFKRLYLLDRELALHVTDRAVILYSPTFIHTQQEFYIFGYALINSSSFYSGEPNPKIFIYDFVADYAFRDTFLNIVLQKAKQDGDVALHYDDGRTYGCVLDLSRIQGLVREGDVLLLGDQFEPNAVYRNMVARSQKALSQDRYGEVRIQLEEIAYAKSQ